MKILADENIPFVRDAFGGLGEVTTCAGRSLDAAQLADAAAELLLIRSVTDVDAALLSGNKSLRFIATATAGIDHVDTQLLAERGIGFASAAGSNAESVAQYVTAAILELAVQNRVSLAGKTLGIIGAGHVGRRVARNAESLGMTVLLNDPPLQRSADNTDDSSPGYVPLEALFDVDILSLHVPFIAGGVDRTARLIDASFLQKLRSDCWLINTCRGEVIDEMALLQSLKKGRSGHIVLDVWESEPTISLELLEHVAIATPHIAGYSFDGKVRGTQMIYEAACQFFDLLSCWDIDRQLPAAATPFLSLATAGIGQEIAVTKESARAEIERIYEAVQAVYHVRKDDMRNGNAAMRCLSEMSVQQRGKEFDRLRRKYPRRREFSQTTVLLEPFHARFAEVLRGLQFRVSASSIH